MMKKIAAGMTGYELAKLTVTLCENCVFSLVQNLTPEQLRERVEAHAASEWDDAFARMHPAQLYAWRARKEAPRFDDATHKPLLRWELVSYDVWAEGDEGWRVNSERVIGHAYGRCDLDDDDAHEMLHGIGLDLQHGDTLNWLESDCCELEDEHGKPIGRIQCSDWSNANNEDS